MSRLERAAPRTPRSLSGLPHRSRVPGQIPASAPKTYKSALVIIPPRETWGPIQGLRRTHDRHFRRWMPHITLIYPFRPVSEFESLTPLLAEVCGKTAPFEIHLVNFGDFQHRGKNTILYLIPEPVRPLRLLQAAIQSKVPDCDDVGRFPGGYVPHLSVGQVRGNKTKASRDAWQAAWRPITFTVTHASLIWRNDPPDDVFRVGPVLPLGG